jgi:hypothetical protein
MLPPPPLVGDLRDTLQFGFLFLEGKPGAL